ncbi:MAG: glycosyltransferase family 2 protein [Candidatus Yonathbacteria bacterium]|nr:glycosyltransferase family 2 protein [Candidatus Yonathbacteria bacterium]NTW47762.1 glycosyltransferase family 2 protein [Candidatus Yonathbacteria bacterium]
MHPYSDSSLFVTSAFLTYVTYTVLFVSLYVEVFYTLSFFEKGSLRRPEEPPENPRHPKPLPDVTILVPCWNEETTVEKTVHSLLSLNYPKKKLFLFLINDGSTDKTWDIMKKFEGHPQIRLFQKENGGKHTALNLGLEHVQTEIVGSLDADSFVHPEALLRMIDTFQKDKDVMAVTPAMKIYRPDSLMRLIQHAEYLLGVFLRKAGANMNALYVTPGPFSLFRTIIFEKIGNYKNAHLTEDMEFAMRMQHNGYRIGNRSDAYVYTVGPKTLKALYKQRLRWTYGFINNARDYRTLFFNPKHGDLGILIMPTAMFFLFAAIFFSGIALFTWGKDIWKGVEQLRAVGFQFPDFSLPTWFFFNTDAIIFITAAVLALTLGILVIGKKIGGEEPRIIWWDTLSFLLLYGAIATLWNIAAVYKTLTSKKVFWR